MNHFKIARPLWLNTFGRTAVAGFCFIYTVIRTQINEQTNIGIARKNIGYRAP